MKDILDKLGLEDVNPGTWLGADALQSHDSALIESINPATGECIARVRSTTEAAFAQMLAPDRASATEWRKWRRCPCRKRPPPPSERRSTACRARPRRSAPCESWARNSATFSCHCSPT